MHRVQIHHSLIIESIAAVFHVISREKGRLLPEDLKRKIIHTEFVEYIEKEQHLHFFMFELLAFTKERSDFKLFKKEVEELDITKLQFCLLLGQCPLHDIETSTVEVLAKEVNVKNYDLYISHLRNPKPLFNDLIDLIDWLYHHPDFITLFNHDIKSDLHDKTQGIREALKKRHPLSLAQSIMGKSFYNIADWKNYEFTYVYFLYPYRFRIMTEDNNIMVLSLYELKKTDEELLNHIKHGMKSLADPTRLSILRMIYANPMFGKEIASTLNLTTATVSHHLDLLKKEGLIHVERDKNTKYFSTNQRRFNQLITQLDQYIKKQST